MEGVERERVAAVVAVVAVVVVMVALVLVLVVLLVAGFFHMCRTCSLRTPGNKIAVPWREVDARNIMRPATCNHGSRARNLACYLSFAHHSWM